jgi:SAM-dependent methyltransferase/uncharacterized protein YbaR (Trm112 family)
LRADAASGLPLICPTCRNRTAAGLDLHTLAVEKIAREANGEILQGVLRCENVSCRDRFPIVDGIAILVADLSRFLSGQLAFVVERDLAPEVAELLALAGPDDAPYARMAEHLSTYVDAHWGDRATPPPDGPKGTPPFGMHELAARVAGRTKRVKSAVELGCSVGRGLAELARNADEVVGVDLHFGALRRARRVLSGDPLTYARRQVGRHYTAATATAGDRAAPRVTLICGDALDPPLAPGFFDRALALNLLDAVVDPPQLLDVLDGLCAPGGELLIASPYSWQSGTTDEERRIGGDDPAAELARRLRDKGLTIEEEAELFWWLRRDSRSGHAYSVHWIAAAKPR